MTNYDTITHPYFDMQLKEWELAVTADIGDTYTMVGGPFHGWETPIDPLEHPECEGEYETLFLPIPGWKDMAAEYAFDAEVNQYFFVGAHLDY